MKNNLRQLLKEKNMTIAELSRRSEVPAKTLYHWMTGQQPRKIAHLLSVCRILQTTVEELYAVRESCKDEPKTGESSEQ